MTEEELMRDFERNVRGKVEKLRKDLIEGSRTEGYEAKGILKPLNPYRPCCLNCISFEDGYCRRMPGVNNYKPHPRHQNRCGYFKNKNLNR